MNINFKIFLLFFALLAALPVLAQEYQPEIFKAQVIEIKAEQDGQQDISLKVLTGSLQDQEIIIQGIDELKVVSSQMYQVGDKVIVSKDQDIEGNVHFAILDYDRSQSLSWLLAIFVLSVLVVGRWQGLRSLVALVFSFLVIIKFIVPQIMAGHNPVLVSVVGGIIILWLAIFFTHGFNKKSLIANLSLSLALFLTAILSFVFTSSARLSGYIGDETLYLLDIGGQNINLQGLLLAGILIGTLGILDDVIISQISAIAEIKKANPHLSKKEVYRRSFRVGVDHITSMINTLFFAYAGASLPLLILFTQSDITGLSLWQAVNSEIIATEIVRTLIGSIGIILSVPIANYLASYFLKIKSDSKIA